MGGTVFWLVKRVGPDVAAYFDAKRQVSGPLKVTLVHLHSQFQKPLF